MDKELSLIELASDGRHFAEARDGVVRIIDSLTGKVVKIQSTVGSPPVLPEDFSEVLLPTGDKVLVQKGLEKYALDAQKQPELQPFLIDIICQKMVEQGKGLADVCKEPGMPSYHTISKWRRKHSWVAQALADARIDRAEHMRDKAVSTAEAAENPEESIDADKLRVETYKWAAGVDDSKFSPRAKVEASVSLNQPIVIVTGIDRSSDVIETSSRDVSQKDST